LYRHLFVYGVDVHVLGGSVRTVERNAEALVVDSKETGVEVHADTAKHVVMSRDQGARRSHSMKTDNSSFERMEEFKYLGTTLAKSNFYSGRN